MFLAGRFLAQDCLLEELCKALVLSFADPYQQLCHTGRDNIHIDVRFSRDIVGTLAHAAKVSFPEEPSRNKTGLKSRLSRSALADSQSPRCIAANSHFPPHGQNSINRVAFTTTSHLGNPGAQTTVLNRPPSSDTNSLNCRSRAALINTHSTMRLLFSP